MYLLKYYFCFLLLFSLSLNGLCQDFVFEPNTVTNIPSTERSLLVDEVEFNNSSYNIRVFTTLFEEDYSGDFSLVLSDETMENEYYRTRIKLDDIQSGNLGRIYTPEKILQVGDTLFVIGSQTFPSGNFNMPNSVVISTFLMNVFTQELLYFGSHVYGSAHNYYKVHDAEIYGGSIVLVGESTRVADQHKSSFIADYYFFSSIINSIDYFRLSNPGGPSVLSFKDVEVVGNRLVVAADVEENGDYFNGIILCDATSHNVIKERYWATPWNLSDNVNPYLKSRSYVKDLYVYENSGKILVGMDNHKVFQVGNNSSSIRRKAGVVIVNHNLTISNAIEHNIKDTNISFEQFKNYKEEENHTVLSFNNNRTTITRFYNASGKRKINMYNHPPSQLTNPNTGNQRFYATGANPAELNWFGIAKNIQEGISSSPVNHYEGYNYYSITNDCKFTEFLYTSDKAIKELSKKVEEVNQSFNVQLGLNESFPNYGFQTEDFYCNNLTPLATEEEIEFHLDVVENINTVFSEKVDVSFYDLAGSYLGHKMVSSLKEVYDLELLQVNSAMVIAKYVDPDGRVHSMKIFVD